MSPLYLNEEFILLCLCARSAWRCAQNSLIIQATNRIKTRRQWSNSLTNENRLKRRPIDKEIIDKWKHPFFGWWASHQKWTKKKIITRAMIRCCRLRRRRRCCCSCFGHRPRQVQVLTASLSFLSKKPAWMAKEWLLYYRIFKHGLSCWGEVLIVKDHTLNSSKKYELMSKNRLTFREKKRIIALFVNRPHFRSGLWM